MRRLLLPGMDGTGDLFGPFVALDPDPDGTLVVAYPRREALGYDALLRYVLDRLPASGPYVVVGESFSGPVAVRVAAERPPGLVGLVLVATFVRNPTSLPVFTVPSVGFAVTPPAWALRWALGGDPIVARDVRRALGTVAGHVLAHRVREILATDVTRALAACAVPILYLQGTRDRLVGPRSAAEVLAVRPDTRVVAIDAPHLVLQTAPALAHAAIRAWVHTLR